MTILEKEFIKSFNSYSGDVTIIADSKGWGIGLAPTDKSIALEIALMHSELSEALEALRIGNPPDNHIPEFNGLEAEFADTIIKIMHVGKALGLRIPEAIIAKIKYNAKRPFKHGNKRF